MVRCRTELPAVAGVDVDSRVRGGPPVGPDLSGRGRPVWSRNVDGNLTAEMLGPAAGRRRVKDEHEPIFFVSPRARLGRAWFASFLPLIQFYDF